MKLIFLILTTISGCFNQNTQIDVIDLEGIKINGHLMLGRDEDFLIKALGESDSVSRSFDPIVDESPFYTYYFNKSSFDVVEGRVVGFSLRDRYFDLNGVKVGEDYTVLKNKYPNSFQKKYTPTDYQNHFIVMVNIANGGGRTDSYIRFWWDKKTNKISMIDFWEDL